MDLETLEKKNDRIEDCKRSKVMEAPKQLCGLYIKLFKEKLTNNISIKE